MKISTEIKLREGDRRSQRKIKHQQIMKKRTFLNNKGLGVSRKPSENHNSNKDKVNIEKKESDMITPENKKPEPTKITNIFEDAKDLTTSSKRLARSVTFMPRKSV